MLKEVEIPSQPQGFGTDELDHVVSSVYVVENQYVIKDQPLFDIETDNVVMEVVAKTGGKVQQLNLKVGDITVPGRVACVINQSIQPSFALKVVWWTLNKVFVSGVIFGALITSLLWWLF